MRGLKVAAAVGAVVSAVVLGSAGTASAASSTVSCPGRNVTCVNSFYHSSLSLVNVKADIYGSGTTSYRWELHRADGSIACYGDLKPSDASRNWNCNSIPVGQFELRMYTGTNTGVLGYTA